MILLMKMRHKVCRVLVIIKAAHSPDLFGGKLGCNFIEKDKIEITEPVNISYYISISL